MTAIQDITALEVSDADLAALLGVTSRHIRGLAQDGRFAKIGRNTYRLGDALRGFLEGKKTSDSAAKRLIEERVRKLSADADLAELNLAKERGDIAPVQQFERAQAKMMAAIQVNILNVPSRAVLQLLGCGDEGVFKATLRSELVLALQQSAQADIDLDDTDDEPDETLYDDEGLAE